MGALIVPRIELAVDLENTDLGVLATDNLAPTLGEIFDKSHQKFGHPAPPVGVHHVSLGGDLMYKNINRSFTSSPTINWNSDPDQKYAQTVLNSGYAVTGYASETAYKTC